MKMQEEIAVVSSLDLSTTEKIESFLQKEAVCKVKRCGGRGLVAATDVDSVEEGRRIYQYWKERF